MTDAEYMRRVTAMERKLYRIAHSILWNDPDCADAIQEAVIKGWQKRASLQEERYFETWLVRIVINESKNILRRRRLHILPLDEGVRAPGAVEEDMVESVLLRDALKKLPEKYRTVLLLHHLEGYDLNEVAHIVGATQTAIRSRLHQARKALKNLMEAEGGERP